MRKNMKIAIPVMVVVLAVLVVLKAVGMLNINSGVRLGFVGNDGFHKYNGRYSKISGSFTHTLSPSKDSDTLHCVIKTESGILHVEITEKSTNTVLLDKDFSEDEEFDLQASGRVRIRLTTDEHKGSYLFQY